MALKLKRLLSLSGGVTKDGATYDLTYKVTTDNQNDGPQLVRGYVGWNYGDHYKLGNDEDQLSFVSSIDVRELDPNKRVDWEVGVSFTPPDTSGGQSDDPLSDPIEIEWGYEERTRNVLVDIHGQPIVNAAGDFYDEYVQVDDFRRTLTIIRNEANFPKALADALSNKLNDDVWNGYAKGVVKLKPIVSNRVYHGRIGFYWQTRYEFIFAAIDETWERELVSAGFNHISGGQKYPIYLPIDPNPGDEIELATTAQPLQPDGSIWRPGDPLGVNKWEVLHYADFTQLNLDNVL